MRRKGTTRLYYDFLHHLFARRRKIAVLQCLGRLGEYLTKEFATLSMSNRSHSPAHESRQPGEQKIDISLLEGNFSNGISKDNARIRAFVEIKYLRNLHRAGPHSAEDEIRTTLVDLKRQLWQFDKPEHAGYQVQLRGRRRDIWRRDIYGMVFASYLHDRTEEEAHERFLKRINPYRSAPLAAVARCLE